MSYTLTRYQLTVDPDGKFPFTIGNNTVNNTTTSLNLLGQGVTNYGQLVAEDFVYMLENFAGPLQPSNKITGQTWYDSVNQTLKVNMGATWKVLGSSVTNNVQPSNPSIGDLWYNTAQNQEFVWNGSNWVLVGPSSSDPLNNQISFQPYTLPGPSTTQVLRIIANNQTVALVATVAIANGSLLNNAAPYNDQTNFPNGLQPGFNLAVSGIVSGIINPSASSAPASPITGDIYWNSTSNQLFGYNGTAWVLIGPASSNAGNTQEFDIIAGVNVFRIIINSQTWAIWSSGVIAAGALVNNPAPYNDVTNFPNGLISGLNLAISSGIGGLKVSIPISSVITGSARTMIVGDWNQMIQRANSGVVMTDTLPVIPSILPTGWNAIYYNSDSSAILVIGVASGANLNGSPAGTILLGPAQQATVGSDGINYYTIDAPGRARLGATTNLYVGTLGSDTNNGLAVGSAFLTIQRAINVLAQFYDLNGKVATINVADGVYTAGMAISGSLVGQFGSSQLSIVGDTVTPANCSINVTNGDAFVASSGASFLLNGFQIAASGSSPNGVGISAGQAGEVVFQNCVFGVCGLSHLYTAFGGLIVASGNYAISGGSTTHMNSQAAGSISMSGITVTLNGTPNFSTAFAEAVNTGNIQALSMTYTGAASGIRYFANVNGVINTNGGGANYFPGNSAGSPTPDTLGTTGGIYV